MNNQYSVQITGLVRNIDNVNFIAGKNVYYDSEGNISHDSNGKYIGYAVGNNSMIVRPEFMDNPTISRSFKAEANVNNKYVQVDVNTNLVSPLPLKNQGIEITNINQTFPQNDDKNFIHLKNNLFLLVSKKYPDGFIHLYSYSNNQMNQVSSKIFKNNELTSIRKVEKLKDDTVIIVFNDHDGNQTNTYMIVASIDYNDNSLSISPTSKMDDMLAIESERVHIIKVSDTRFIYLYNHNTYSSGSGYTKAQIFEYNSISNMLLKVTTPTILQSGLSSTEDTNIIKLNDRYLYICSCQVNGVNKFTSTFFTIQENNIVKEHEDIQNGFMTVGKIQVKVIEDNKVLMLYRKVSDYKIYMRICTVNPDLSMIFGQEQLGIDGGVQFLDDTLVENSMYFTNNSIIYHLRYSIDESDNIEYTVKAGTGERFEINSYIVKIDNHNYRIVSKHNNVRKIVNTETNFVGFYHNGRVYYYGFIPYVGEDIENGKLYYWDSQGNYTTELNGNSLLGLGLGKGLFIYERNVESDEVPMNYTYTVNSTSPMNEMWVGDLKHWTIARLANGVTDESATFSFSIDPLGNNAAIASIEGTTNNRVSIRASSNFSYVGKWFRVIATDSQTGEVAITQDVQVVSLF